MSFLDRIAACNNADMTRYLPFYGLGMRLGWVREDRTHLLADHPEVFVVGGRRIDLHGALYEYSSATDALALVTESWRDAGVISGWRGERYAAAKRFGESAVLSIERAACPMLGIRSWGFHLNGYVRRADGIHLWIAERAHDKPTYPGELDNTVAGGHPEGLTIRQNIIKECDEEASIPEALASQARAAGAICYRHETGEGLKPDEMFCFDLELPDDFTPVPNDGEVAEFRLMPAQEVLEIVRDTDKFKYNCALVLIDFFIRHGYLDPDSEPFYTTICAALNQGNRPDA